MILAGGGTDFTRASERFARLGTHVVFIGRPAHAWPSVRIPNADAAATAVGHLAALGHSRVGFIAGLSAMTTSQDRFEGYTRSVAVHGLDDDEQLLREGDFDERSGYRAARSLLSVSPPPTAIFAANDRMAVGALAAAHDHGLRVPDDLSLVGFDDIPAVSDLRPPLTPVALPAYDTGAAAMGLLLQQLDGEGPGGADGPAVVRLPARCACGPQRALRPPATDTPQPNPRGEASMANHESLDGYTTDGESIRKHNLLTMSFAEVEERLQEEGQDVVLIPLTTSDFPERAWVER